MCWTHKIWGLSGILISNSLNIMDKQDSITVWMCV